MVRETLRRDPDRKSTFTEAQTRMAGVGAGQQPGVRVLIIVYIRQHARMPDYGLDRAAADSITGMRSVGSDRTLIVAGREIDGLVDAIVADHARHRAQRLLSKTRRGHVLRTASVA